MDLVLLWYIVPIVDLVPLWFMICPLTGHSMHHNGTKSFIYQNGTKSNNGTIRFHYNGIYMSGDVVTATSVPPFYQIFCLLRKNILL